MDLHQKLIISKIITYLCTILIGIEKRAIKIINKINQTIINHEIKTQNLKPCRLIKYFIDMYRGFSIKKSFNALIIIWPV